MTVWSSNGDIVKGTVQVVESGDMHVTGKIDGESLVVLESTGGSITIDEKIDGHSNVSLKAAGNITVGTQGGSGNEKIDGWSHVEAVAGGNIALGSYIHKATVDFSAHGGISLTDIDYGATVRLLADGGISLASKIDGASRVDIVSNRGSITIDGKIDGSSNVHLTAAQSILIGQTGGSGDRKIAGNSFVAASAGGNLALGGGIFESHTEVDFAAAGNVTIDEEISGGPTVRLLSGAGQITVAGGISGGATDVITFPNGALDANVHGGATVQVAEWAAPVPLSPTAAADGYWWENWGQTFGYVGPFRVVPRSLEDIAAAIVGPPSFFPET